MFILRPPNYFQQNVCLQKKSYETIFDEKMMGLRDEYAIIKTSRFSQVQGTGIKAASTLGSSTKRFTLTRS